MQLNQVDIRLNQKFNDKESAIRFAGQLLVERSYVKEEYIAEMVKRDKLTSTFIGNYVAIPHGTEQSKQFILKSGVVIIQVPDGVDFDGNEVKIVIGIAGAEGEHLDVLTSIAVVCSDTENVAKIVAAESEADIIRIFEGSER